MIDVGQFRQHKAAIFGTRAKCLPGRLCVMMDCPIEGLIVTNKEPVTGIVVDSGVDYLNYGDRVIVHPEHGLQMDYRDAEWIPRGADVRFYGVAVPVSESVIAVLVGGA